MERRLGDPDPASGTDAGERVPALPVVMTADSWDELADRMSSAATRLEHASDEGIVRGFLLPAALVPSPRNQAANRDRVRELAAARDRLVTATLDAGFSEEAVALTRAITESWERLDADGTSSPWVLPGSDLARWLIGRAVSGPDPGEDPTGPCAAVGSLQPVSIATDETGHLAWAAGINGPGVQVTGWELLNPALQARVAGDFRRVFLPMAGVLVLMLIAVFRNLRDVGLALGSLVFSGVILLTVTRWLPAVEWNTFNVAALPILFGTGLDYSIHMIFALRRSGGALPPVRNGIARALMFCGLSTAFGFGSLAFASSEGLASLGLVCAIGMLINMLTAIHLLPHWWRASHRGAITA